MQRMFELDWRRCMQAGMVKDPERVNLEGDAEVDTD
jgi:hypothetical protein